MTPSGILIEDTHWPLVVVGVCCGPRLDRQSLARAQARWRSREPRAAILVVPCRGQMALAAHDALLRWLRLQPVQTALCYSAAWVIPDDALRAGVTLMQRVSGHLAFGGHVATFRDVAHALRWSCGQPRVEESSLPVPLRVVKNFDSHP